MPKQGQPMLKTAAQPPGVQFAFHLLQQNPQILQGLQSGSNGISDMEKQYAEFMANKRPTTITVNGGNESTQTSALTAETGVRGPTYDAEIAETTDEDPTDANATIANTATVSPIANTTITIADDASTNANSVTTTTTPFTTANGSPISNVHNTTTLVVQHNLTPQTSNKSPPSLEEATAEAKTIIEEALVEVNENRTVATATLPSPSLEQGGLGGTSAPITIDLSTTIENTNANTTGDNIVGKSGMLVFIEEILTTLPRSVQPLVQHLILDNLARVDGLVSKAEGITNLLSEDSQLKKFRHLKAIKLDYAPFIGNTTETLYNIHTWDDILCNTKKELHELVVSQAKYEYDMMVNENIDLFLRNLTKLTTPQCIYVMKRMNIDDSIRDVFATACTLYFLKSADQEFFEMAFKCKKSKVIGRFQEQYIDTETETESIDNLCAELDSEDTFTTIDIERRGVIEVKNWLLLLVPPAAKNTLYGVDAMKREKEARLLRDAHIQHGAKVDIAKQIKQAMAGTSNDATLKSLEKYVEEQFRQTSNKRKKENNGKRKYIKNMARKAQKVDKANGSRNNGNGPYSNRPNNNNNNNNNNNQNFHNPPTYPTQHHHNNNTTTNYYPRPNPTHPTPNTTTNYYPRPNPTHPTPVSNTPNGFTNTPNQNQAKYTGLARFATPTPNEARHTNVPNFHQRNTNHGRNQSAASVTRPTNATTHQQNRHRFTGNSAIRNVNRIIANPYVRSNATQLQNRHPSGNNSTARRLYQRSGPFSLQRNNAGNETDTAGNQAQRKY